MQSECTQAWSVTHADLPCSCQHCPATAVHRAPSLQNIAVMCLILSIFVAHLNHRGAALYNITSQIFILMIFY